MLLLERDAQNRRSWVIANSPQSQHLSPPRRKFASVFCDDLLRGLLQVARAAVITKAGPQPQHFLFRRSGERVEIGEAFEKPFVIGNPRGDTRLLQHDFRQPHAIRVARAAPGQVALEMAEPGKQVSAECGEVLSREHGASRDSRTSSEGFAQLYFRSIALPLRGRR